MIIKVSQFEYQHYATKANDHIRYDKSNLCCVDVITCLQEVEWPVLRGYCVEDFSRVRTFNRNTLFFINLEPLCHPVSLINKIFAHNPRFNGYNSYKYIYICIYILSVPKFTANLYCTCLIKYRFAVYLSKFSTDLR